jgi:F-box interacting protein
MQFNYQEIHNPENVLCGPTFYRYALPGVSKEEFNTKYMAYHCRFYSLHFLSTQNAVAYSLPGFRNLFGNYHIQETVGYCHGILCLQMSGKDSSLMTKHLLFGNPYSGVYKVILIQVDFPLLSRFVYDSSHDDHICVLVHRITRNVHIYSLKLNSWRIKSGLFQLERIKCKVGIALDMSLYWLDDESNRIIEYDVKHDQLTEMLLPSEMPLPTEMPESEFFLKVVGKSICITDLNTETGQVEMWLFLKQEEKWSKFLSVNLEEEFGHFLIYPLSFTKDGRVLCDILYVNDPLFAVIDPKTGSVEDLTVTDESGGTRE